MSKKSCEAAESIEDALLRMARVNWQQYLLNAQCGNRNLSLTRPAARAGIPYTGFHFILVVPPSSLVPFCKQISCLHENLLAERYEGSAIS